MVLNRPPYETNQTIINLRFIGGFWGGGGGPVGGGFVSLGKISRFVCVGPFFFGNSLLQAEIPIFFILPFF